MEMLKSTFSNRASFCFRQAFARLAHKKQYASPVAHTRRREEFLERQMQNLYRKKPSFNRKYDPLSRNVYRKVEDDEDHNDMDETEDRFWRLTDKEMYDNFQLFLHMIKLEQVPRGTRIPPAGTIS